MLQKQRKPGDTGSGNPSAGPQVKTGKAEAAADAARKAREMVARMDTERAEADARAKERAREQELERSRARARTSCCGCCR